MTTTVNSAADTGLPDERPEPKAQSIMDLFAEWQALGQTDRISLSDEENEAVSDRMSGLVQSMKDIGPRTAGEMAAFVYARTLGFEVVCEEEDAKYLLDAIEAEQQPSVPTKIADALHFQAHAFIQKVERLDAQGLNHLATFMTTDLERWGEHSSLLAEMAAIVRDRAAKIEQRASA